MLANRIRSGDRFDGGNNPCPEFPGIKMMGPRSPSAIGAFVFKADAGLRAATTPPSPSRGSVDQRVRGRTREAVLLEAARPAHSMNTLDADPAGD